MAEGRAWSGWLWNAALAVGALVLTVLLIAFVARLLEPPGGLATSPHRGDPLGRALVVEVFNGTGEPGLATRMRVYLVSHGADVVASGNWRRTDVEHSQVIDRAGNREAALRVARAAGIAEQHIIEDPRPDLHLHATIVLGRDYASLPAFAP
jgi:hypothetical protein